MESVLAEGEGAFYHFTVLGCGSSPGVPRINGDWGNCDPSNPKNKRLRCSLLIERIAADGRKTTIVIDTGPDFREQMIAAGVERLDAVIYTHAHADHIHGIDDLRGFVLVQRHRIPVYADETTMARLKSGFGYCFETPDGSNYPPIVDAVQIEAGREFEIQGDGGPIRILPLRQIHAENSSLAFRIGGLAYCTDVSGFPAETSAALHGLDALIIDALQYRPHPSHFSLDEALEWIGRLDPKNAYLTHMHTPLDYETVMRETPDHVYPSYDGLQIVLSE